MGSRLRRNLSGSTAGLWMDIYKTHMPVLHEERGAGDPRVFRSPTRSRLTAEAAQKVFFGGEDPATGRPGQRDVAAQGTDGSPGQCSMPAASEDSLASLWLWWVQTILPFPGELSP